MRDESDYCVECGWEDDSDYHCSICAECVPDGMGVCEDCEPID